MQVKDTKPTTFPYMYGNVVDLEPSAGRETTDKTVFAKYTSDINQQYAMYVQGIMTRDMTLHTPTFCLS